MGMHDLPVLAKYCPGLQYSVGALLVNRAAARFILRFGSAESKGCAPACHDVSSADPQAFEFVAAGPVSWDRAAVAAGLPLYLNLWRSSRFAWQALLTQQSQGHGM